MPRFGKRSEQIKMQLHYVLQAILDEAIKDPPFDFGLHEGRRTLEKQYNYYMNGKSKIDGYTKRGYHNYQPALAFDFHCSISGNTWDDVREEVDGDPAYLEEIAMHILRVAREDFGIILKWGGEWNFKDSPHIQLPRIFKKEAEEKKHF